MTDPVWRKSSYSSGNDGNCVEIAFIGGSVGMRDSKNPGGSSLIIAPTTLTALLGGVKAGRLAT